MDADKERSKTLSGSGVAKRTNSPDVLVSYQISVRYKATQPPKIIEIDAEITGPANAAYELTGASATLVLVYGTQLDGLRGNNGHFTLSNYGNAIRGDLI